MDIEAFVGLEGRKLSVILNKTKADGTPESYIAYLEKVGSDYLVLDYEGASTNNKAKIAKVIVCVDIILSIWVFQE